MESLFCYEKLPTIGCPASSAPSFFTSKEDHEAAIRVCMGKELSCMPRQGYVEELQSDSYLIGARLRAIQWFIKCQRRLQLSVDAVFIAANCLDRFLSLHNCNTDWRQWMMELVSVACLSVASKFTDTAFPSMHAIQMEGLDHSFQASNIQEMELLLLKALQWRICSITACSYLEWLMQDFGNCHYILKGGCLTEVLIDTLTDIRFLQFRPSIIAAAAINCTIKKLAPFRPTCLLYFVTKITSVHSKADLVKCQMIMENRSSELDYKIAYCNYSSSPVTVLSRCSVDDQCLDNHSLWKVPCSSTDVPLARKRKKMLETQD